MLASSGDPRRFNAFKKRIRHMESVSSSNDRLFVAKARNAKVYGGATEPA